MKGLCLCCERKYKALTQRGKFCSPSCRLLYWAAHRLIREYRAGRANGLKELIQELKDESK